MTSSPIEGGHARTATVVRVIDGDTFEVRFKTGETDTVRLIGVDTPEVADQYMDPPEYNVPDTPTGRDWLLKWGHRASGFATDKLAGEQVRVVTDPESDSRGYYDRLLAYVYIDGENLGHELLERGLARVYSEGEFVLESKYLDSEADAQAANRGVWGFEAATTSTATATPTPVPDTGGDSGGSDLPPPSGGASDPYDCGDFSSQQQAQEYFENHNPDEDPSGLDGEGDGKVCESLP